MKRFLRYFDSFQAVCVLQI